MLIAGRSQIITTVNFIALFVNWHSIKNGVFWDVTPYGSTFRRNLAPPSSG
jgi:hypothetical protein